MMKSRTYAFRLTTPPLVRDCTLLAQSRTLWMLLICTGDTDERTSRLKANNS